MLQKYFTQLYISRYPFIPTNPLLAVMSFFFPFSSKIPYAYFLNGSTPKKKTCIKCAIATYEHYKQSLRCTYNANKIREISPKKFWLLNWTPQRFRQIDAPVGGAWLSRLRLWAGFTLCGALGTLEIFATSFSQIKVKTKKSLSI